MGYLPAAPGAEESQGYVGQSPIHTPISVPPHPQPVELHFRPSPAGALSDTPDTAQHTVLVMRLSLWTQLPSQGLPGLWS